MNEEGLKDVKDVKDSGSKKHLRVLLSCPQRYLRLDKGRIPVVHSRFGLVYHTIR